MKTFKLTPEDNLQEVFDGICDPAVVLLSKGIYSQKVKIKCSNVTIIGEGRENTVITFDDYAKKIHADGKEYNTFRTYTLCVTGENVKIENITVENSNTSPESVGQCVALSVNCKRFFAKNVNLKSTQDTLFSAPFPDDLVVRYRGFIPQDELYAEGTSLHFFENCKISGTVDFIFGCAEAYFKNCEITSLKDARDIGFVAAPAHPLAVKHGFVFIGCNFISGGAERATCFLARPWRDFGKCEFINCRVGEHISPCLFDKWNDTERDKTARFLYYNLDCAFNPAPVIWSRELAESEVNNIIMRFKEKFTENMR